MVSELKTRLTLRLPVKMYNALKMESNFQKKCMNDIIIDHIKQKQCRTCAEGIASYCEECLYESFMKGEEKCLKKGR